MKRIRSAFASNQVLKAHDVGDAVASGGPSNLWKIHDAVQRTPHQEVSVWVLDKKALMNSKELKKPQKEKLLEVLRKGPSKLQLLKHPQVLAVTMPMDESKDIIAFATERVFASLNNVLGKTDNIDRVPLTLKEYDMLDLEVTMGLLSISSALGFAHQAEIIHGNLTPEAIVLNKDGEWRLSGFDWWCHSRYTAEAEFPSFPESQISSALLRASLPNLNFLAPEYVMQQAKTLKSDIYSLAMVAVCCYNGGNPLHDARGNVLDYQTSLEKISRME
eukprot:gene19887-29077_t